MSPVLRTLIFTVFVPGFWTVAMPYRIVRNPMYWSVALVVLGEAAVFHSFALVELVAAFAVGVNVFVLLYEEPTLRRKFGEEYEAYCKRVPRWVPQLRAK